MQEVFVVVEELGAMCGVLSVGYESREDAEEVVGKIIAENGYAKIVSVHIKQEQKEKRQ